MNESNQHTNGRPNGSRRRVLSPLGELLSEFDQVFRADPTFGLFPGAPLSQVVAKSRAGTQNNPAFPVDIWEGGTNFVLRADLPGVKSEEVDLSLDGDELTLTVKQHGPASPEGKVLHNERRRLEGVRKFTLPKTAAGDSIKAELREGVLEVLIEKQPEKQVRRISVTAA